MLKSDLEKTLLFLTYLEPRVPSIQTQDASVAENTLKEANAQGVPGRYSNTGQKDVLDSRTLEWKPGDGKSARGKKSGTNH